MRFWRVAQPVDQRKRDLDLPLMSVSQYWGVQLRADLTDELSRAEDLSNYKICRAGQLVINRMSAYQGALGISPIDGVTSPDYLILQFYAGHYGPFWEYLMRSNQFVAEMSARVKGIGTIDNKGVRTPRIGYPELKNIRVPDYDYKEQHAIADFLDRETAKIDAMTAKQTALIELLKERRAAAITEAVTPSNENNCKVLRLSRIAGLVTGTTPSGNYDDLYDPEEGMPWITPENLKDEIVATRWLTNNGTKQMRILQGPSVLVCGIGTVGKLGYTNEACTFNQQITGLVAKSGILPRFLYYALEGYKPFVISAAVGNTLPILNNQRLGAVYLPVPLLSEQRAIVDHLDGVTAKIDTLIAKAEESIALSQERRAALITAAVTGQIDVRD